MTFGAPDVGVEQFASMLQYQGLSRPGDDGRAVPALAESWEWDPSGLQLRVHLRSGVLAHNGRPLTGPMVADALLQAVRSKSNQAQYWSLSSVGNVEAVAADEITITVNSALGALPDDLYLPLMFGDRKDGTGPYRLVENTIDRVVLESFEQYHAGRPVIDRVVIQPYKTLRTAWTSLLRDDVDMVTNVPPDVVEFISNDRIAVTSFPRVYQYMMAFNSRRSPLRSPAVRQALNVAVDRDRLLARVLGGRGLPATGPLWPQNWAVDSSVQPYMFDPGRAEALLDQNGFPRSTRGRLDARVVRFSFTCLLPANFSIEERLALEIQQDLYKIGVDVRFEVLPPAEYNSRLLSGDFEAALVDLISGPTFGRPFMFWRSARNFRGFNVFGYENPEAERLFTVLRETRDDATTRSAARRLQEVFLDDPPALFIAWNERARAVSRDFQIVQDPGRDPALTLWRWTARPSAPGPVQ